MDEKQADQIAGLAMSCALACASGQDTVTITTRGVRPKGFPRGELLSVGTDGSRNYACNPVKVLAWLHSRAKGHNEQEPPAAENISVG